MVNTKSATTRRRLLTITEAANEANVSERMIRRLIADRRLPHYKVGCRHVRIAAADLDAFIDNGRVEAMRTPEALLRR